MGWFRKINKNGEDYKPIGNVITATSLSVSGPDLADGDVVRVMFTTDIADANTPGGTTPLALTWNGGATPIPVKASKEGSLASIYSFEYATNLFRYISAYVTLELAYDGTNQQFVVVGNPVILSGSNYTIYADGTNAKDFNVYTTGTGDGYKINNLTSNISADATYKKIKLKDNLYLISLRGVVNVSTAGMIALSFSYPSNVTVIDTLSLNACQSGDVNSALHFCNTATGAFYVFCTVNNYTAIAYCLLLATIS